MMNPHVVEATLAQLKSCLDACEAAPGMDAATELLRETVDLWGERVMRIEAALAVEAENTRLAALACRLECENGVLGVEENHKRRVIRSLLHATGSVVGTAEYATAEGTSCFYETVGDSGQNPVSIDFLNTEKIAVLKKQQQKLSECLEEVTKRWNATETLRANEDSEINAGIDELLGYLGGMGAGGKREVEVVVKDHNQSLLKAGRCADALERKIISAEHYLENTRDTLKVERESREVDLRELLLRTSQPLAPRRPLVELSRGINVSVEASAATANASRSKIISLQKKIASAKKSVKKIGEDPIPTPSELRGIKMAYAEAEEGFAAHADTTLRAGRHAKLVRTKAAKSQRHVRFRVEE